MRRSISLRTLLLLALVLQLVATAAVITLVSYLGGQHSADRLAQRSQQRASQQVREYLLTYLATPQQVIRLMASEIASGRLDPADPVAVRRFLWGLRTAFPDAPYLNYGWADGDFIGLGQVDNSSRRPFLELAQARSIQRLKQIRLDAAGEPAGLERVKPFADFRGDGWYARPLQAGRPVWTPIYNWVDAPEVMAMGAGMPVRRNGRVLGVAGVDVFLANISHYLQTLSIADSGKVYIVEPNGLLVADVSGRLPFKIVNGRAVRRHAENAEDPIIRDSARVLLARFGNFGALDQSRQLRVPIGHSRALMRVDPYRDAQGLNWRIVVVQPESEVYGDLRDEALNHLSISLVAIAISGGIGLLVIEFVIRGIDRLVVSTDAIADGDLSHAVPTGSIQEIDRLATSFNTMAQRLRRSFSNLRSSNREIQRLVTQRTQALARSEERLQQEIRQRQRIEESLAHDPSATPLRRLAEPSTGLLNRRGLERKLGSGERGRFTRSQPVSLVLLACRADGDASAGPSATARLPRSQRIAAALEVCAADHQGVAAQLDMDRFALLLVGVEAENSRSLLESLVSGLQPLEFRAGAAGLAADAPPDAWQHLLPRAERALEQALAQPALPASPVGLLAWVVLSGPV